MHLPLRRINPHIGSQYVPFLIYLLQNWISWAWPAPLLPVRIFGNRGMYSFQMMSTGGMMEASAVLMVEPSCKLPRLADYRVSFFFPSDYLFSDKPGTMTTFPDDVKLSRLSWLRTSYHQKKLVPYDTIFDLRLLKGPDSITIGNPSSSAQRAVTFPLPRLQRKVWLIIIKIATYGLP